VAGPRSHRDELAARKHRTRVVVAELAKLVRWALY
jgi:hypothetical protein